MKKGFGIVWVVLIVIVLIILVVWLRSSNVEPKVDGTVATTTAATTTKTTDSSSTVVTPVAKKVTAPQVVNFDKSGNLIRNTAGLDKGAWYLFLDHSGQPAPRVKLRFDTSSQCMWEPNPTVKVNCSKLENVGNGVRAQVRGVKEGDTVLVRSITIL